MGEFVHGPRDNGSKVYRDNNGNRGTVSKKIYSGRRDDHSLVKFPSVTQNKNTQENRRTCHGSSIIHELYIIFYLSFFRKDTLEGLGEYTLINQETDSGYRRFRVPKSQSGGPKVINWRVE